MTSNFKTETFDYNQKLSFSIQNQFIYIRRPYPGLCLFNLQCSLFYITCLAWGCSGGLTFFCIVLKSWNTFISFRCVNIIILSKQVIICLSTLKVQLVCLTVWGDSDHQWIRTHMAQHHMVCGWSSEMEADSDVSSMSQMCLWIIQGHKKHFYSIM